METLHRKCHDGIGCSFFCFLLCKGTPMEDNSTATTLGSFDIEEEGHK